MAENKDPSVYEKMKICLHGDPKCCMLKSAGILYDISKETLSTLGHDIESL